MPDERTYIKVHDGMPDHPKIVGLSDRAYRLLTELWCYCSRYLTDGAVTNAVAGKRGAKARAELTAAGLMEKTDDGWLMHDYLEHQRSADEVADRKRKAREAGAKGGKAKAGRLANARGSARHDAKQPSEQPPKRTPSESVPETEEVLRTSQAEEIPSGISQTDNSPEAVASGAALPATLTMTQRSKRIVDSYADAEPMCKWPAVNGIVIKAIKAARWRDDEIRDALLRLAREGRSVTVDSLRYELNGMPAGRPAGPARSTTDERVAQGLALAARYADEDGT